MSRTVHPGLLLDASPDVDISVDSGLDNEDIADSVEYTDLRLARVHAATNVEFYTQILNPGQSLRILKLDASRKRVTILPTALSVTGGTAVSVLISNKDLSGIINPAGLTSGFPGALLGLAGFTSIDIEARDELWLYGFNLGATPSLVSYIVERYSSGV